MSHAVFVPCEEIGCENGIGVHYRHAENFAGRYYCAEHDQPAPREDTTR